MPSETRVSWSDRQPEIIRITLQSGEKLLLDVNEALILCGHLNAVLHDVAKSATS